MAEHLIVVQAVEGSSPFIHPRKIDITPAHAKGIVLCPQTAYGA